MKTTRDRIIDYADALVRDKGFNAFSFNDISKEIGIRKASVHYYFPTKTDLALAVIDKQTVALEHVINDSTDSTPIGKFQEFQNIYSRMYSENTICLVGSLASDYNTLEPPVREAISHFSDVFLNWVMQILSEGLSTGTFKFSGDLRTKALTVIASMMAALQLCRLTEHDDFNLIKQNLINELTT